MLTLYLVRHAKSSWDNALQADFHRPLNARGLRDAPAMAQYFAARSEAVHLFVTSPAARALATAQFVAKAFSAPPENLVHEPKLYLADVAAWNQVVRALPQTARSVALFAHNPGISDFCEALTGAGLGELPTCAMVRIDVHVDEWPLVLAGTGTMVWNDHPKRHSELQ